jgi:hypothetical protein
MALIKLLGDEMPNSALRPILKSDPFLLQSIKMFVFLVFGVMKWNSVL